jgi:hypothetical protein
MIERRNGLLMRMPRILFDLFLIGLGLAFSLGVAELPPESAETTGLCIYQCEHIHRDLFLSGKADDPLWQQAQTIQLTIATNGLPGRCRTTVKMLYNMRFLYLAFECEDDFVWGTLTNHDSAIFGEECVEAFISPSGKPRQYYEINVSPLNTVFDAFILNGRPANGDWSHFLSWKDFTCENLVTRVHVNGELKVRGAKGWSVEYAIPFTSIIGSDNLSPKSGEVWRANFYRIDAPEPGKLEYYSWSATGVNDFHLPWRFGILQFK